MAVISVIMISRQSAISQEEAAEKSFAVSSFFDLDQANHSTFTHLLIAWHLLSLDAPTVAVLWTIFTAATTHTRLPLATPVSMAFAVWTIYVLDRLLDARHLGSSHQSDPSIHLELRHLFHHRHRAAFFTVIAACVTGLAVLLPRLPTTAIRLYLAEGTAMLGYFLLIHARRKLVPDAHSVMLFAAHHIPKELLVGPFFATAIFIPTVSRRPELLLQLLPMALLFAALCSLNCLYIFAWEDSNPSKSPWTATYLIAKLSTFTWLYVAVALICAFTLGTKAHFPAHLYAIACATSALLLFAIHKLFPNSSRLVLRASADAALLTPLFVLPFLSSR